MGNASENDIDIIWRLRSERDAAIASNAALLARAERAEAALHALLYGTMRSFQAAKQNGFEVLASAASEESKRS